MSSKSPEKKFVNVEIIEDDNFDPKQVIIPFSLFFLKDEHFIYDGSEKIPFTKRDSLYQTIFLQEFSGNIRSKG